MTHLPPPQPGSQQPAAPAWQQAQQGQPPQAQPQQLAQPSWATAQPSADASPQRPRGNPLGLVSVLLAAVALLLGLVAAVVQAVLIASNGFEAVGAAPLAFSLARLLVSLAGVALGVVGLLRRDARRTVAAIGLGACAAIAASVLIGLLSVPITAIVTG